MNKNSMLFWYPKIKDLPIPQPGTEFVEIRPDELELMYDEKLPHSVTNRVQGVIEGHFQLPVFIRTDLASGKHSWKNSCYYDGSQKLSRHLLEVITANLIADFFGLPFTHLVIREFIQMKTAFTAFYGDMPVAPERRYFIKDGSMVCHHPYWIQEAIEESPPSMKNWKEILANVNKESEEEVDLLTRHSSLIAQKFDGYWSIDFAKSAQEEWILIDMARGEHSWHPEHEE